MTESKTNSKATAYPISGINRIGPEMAGRLRQVGIRTTTRLLDRARNPQGRKQLAEEVGLDPKRILSWANLVDRMRIKGVGEDYAMLLEAAGVDTVKELKYRNPQKLAHALREANARRKLVQVLPSDRAVVRWIEHAKRLPLKISY
jgi:predicted flap endonuclease-1-like 5' DNA nuclease